MAPVWSLAQSAISKRAAYRSGRLDPAAPYALTRRGVGGQVGVPPGQYTGVSARESRSSVRRCDLAGRVPGRPAERLSRVLDLCLGSSPRRSTWLRWHRCLPGELGSRGRRWISPARLTAAVEKLTTALRTPAPKGRLLRGWSRLSSTLVPSRRFQPFRREPSAHGAMLPSGTPFDPRRRTILPRSTLPGLDSGGYLEVFGSTPTYGYQFDAFSARWCLSCADLNFFYAPNTGAPADDPDDRYIAVNADWYVWSVRPWLPASQPRNSPSRSSTPSAAITAPSWPRIRAVAPQTWRSSIR